MIKTIKILIGIFLSIYFIIILIGTIERLIFFNVDNYLTWATRVIETGKFPFVIDDKHITRTYQALDLICGGNRGRLMWKKDNNIFLRCSELYPGNIYYLKDFQGFSKTEELIFN